MSLNHHIRCVQQSHSNSNTIKYTRAIVVWLPECEWSKSFSKNSRTLCVDIVNEKWLYPPRLAKRVLWWIIYCTWFCCDFESESDVEFEQRKRKTKQKSGLRKPLVWCIAVAWKSPKTRTTQKKINKQIEIYVNGVNCIRSQIENIQLSERTGYFFFKGKHHTLRVRLKFSIFQRSQNRHIPPLHFASNVLRVWNAWDDFDGNPEL